MAKTISISNKALDQLKEEISELKLIFEFPKYFIGNFFNDLRNDIDLAFVKKKHETQSLQQQMKIEGIWTDLRNEIISFEKECKQKQDSQPIDQEITNKIINLLEESYNHLISNRYMTFETESIKPAIKKLNSELENLTGYFSRSLSISSKEELIRAKSKPASNLFQIISESEQFKKFKPMISICENESINDELQDLHDLIYDERKLFEKLMFLNKTMFFLRLDSNEKIEENRRLFAQLDPNINAGVLFLIENEYFDSRTISFFKSSRTKRLTSEVIKCRELKKFLQINNHFYVINSNLVKSNSNKSDLSIDFSGKQLNRLGTDLFTELENVKSINLSNNLIDKVNVNVFNSLDILENDKLNYMISLIKIYLNNNVLRHIDSNAFKGLVNLSMLDLSDNQITSLESNLFNSLINLKEIILRWNYLEKLQPILFKGLYKLQLIDLTGNQINSINRNQLRNYYEVYDSNNIFKLPILF